MGRDKKGDKSADLEYQYSDETLDEGTSSGAEYGEGETPSMPKQQFRLIKDNVLAKLLNKKRLTLILFAVVGIVVIYKFLTVNTTRSMSAEKALEQPLSKPTAVAAQPHKETVTTTAPVVATLPATSPTPAPTLVEAALPTTTAPSGDQAAQLQANLMQANQSLTQLQSAMVTLGNALMKLSDKVLALEAAQLEWRRRMTYAQWTVQSVVTGRAWLHRLHGRGRLITVKVGDVLPGYGEIQKIDSEAGIVYTSSGEQIKYGPNDS